MRPSEIITLCYLCSQGIELLCRRLRPVLPDNQLSLVNGMHNLDPSDCATRCPKGFEAQHGPSEPFSCSVILLHDIIEICGVADHDGRLRSVIVVRDGCRVRAALIDGDFFWESLVMNRLLAEGQGGGSIALRCQQKIHGLAFSVHGALAVGPPPANFHTRLIKPPALAFGSGAGTKLLLDLRSIF